MYKVNLFWYMLHRVCVFFKINFGIHFPMFDKTLSFITANIKKFNDPCGINPVKPGVMLQDRKCCGCSHASEGCIKVSLGCVDNKNIRKCQ